MCYPVIFPEDELARIKSYCINPVDSRETDEVVPETLVTVFEEPADVKIFDGFKDMPEDELKALYDSLGLAMTFKDFLTHPELFSWRRKKRPIDDGDPRVGYILVGSLPSYDIFHRVKKCYV